MPLRLPPLAGEAIEKIEKWIAEGAKFDGASPQSPTEQVVALYMAKHATHEELSRQARDRGPRAMAAGDAGRRSQADRARNRRAVALGRSAKAQLKEVTRRRRKANGESRHDRARAAGKPLVKGRLTLFVFDKRYDYSEFGQMVEKRQLPPRGKGIGNSTWSAPTRASSTAQGGRSDRRAAGPAACAPYTSPAKGACRGGSPKVPAARSRHRSTRATSAPKRGTA